MSKFKKSNLIETNFASGCGSELTLVNVLGVRSIIEDGCTFDHVVMMGADNYEVSFQMTLGWA